MSFLDNIMQSLGLTGLETGFRLTLINKNCCYVEGVLKILKVENNQIKLLVKNGEVLVSGVNLKIRSCYGGDVSIKGEVKKVERLK